MTADNFTEAARIIDAHRENERWVGDGVKIECVCGHTSHATYDFSGPITEDKNNHRDAERMHAAHVAQVLAAQEPTDAELDALYDAFIAHSEDERSEEYTRTEDGEPYHERICSECGEAVWIKGEHYWAATRANGARKRHHVARAALSAARAARRDEEKR